MQYQELTVCVIDDTATALRAAKALLSHAVKEVITVNTTYDALVLLNTRKIDLIFCDVEVPPLTGFDFCRIVKTTTEHKDIPIVLVTSRRGIVDKARGLLVGAQGYVSKPFHRSELVDKLSLAVSGEHE